MGRGRAIRRRCGHAGHCRRAPATSRDRVAVARSRRRHPPARGGRLACGWLCLGTPIVSGFIPHGRPSPMQTAIGILVWGFAIIVPAAFLIMGVAQLASVARGVARLAAPHRSPRTSPGRSAPTTWPRPTSSSRADDASTSWSSGRSGSSVLGDVPPPPSSRHVGSRWEVRDEPRAVDPHRGPVERASRDAERVRGWLAADDRDFLVRVYAAIVTDDDGSSGPRPVRSWRPRTSPAWLEALPGPARPHRRASRARSSSSFAVSPRPAPERRPCRPSGSGRGARTRTWNRRDISPLL